MSLSSPTIENSCGLQEALLPLAQRLLLSKNPPADWRWEPITHGGSDREFFRVRFSAEKSCVLMRYETTREENLLYADIAYFLRKQGIRVPSILFHDSEEHLMGLEDLGEVSLHAVFHSGAASDRVLALYRSALEQIAQLHAHSSSPVPTMPGFDEKLYRWERSYFLENLVTRWAGRQLSSSELIEIEKEGEAMIAALVRSPRCLIHRDFQSQNLMVRNEEVWLIDFQGMRLGHAAYDIASLLYDPYVPLQPRHRVGLMQAYVALLQPEEGEVFESTFYQAAAQRLMQALGAYGFLGLVKNKPSFLAYIPAGLTNLSHALHEMNSMPHTQALVQELLRRVESLVEENSVPDGAQTI